MKYFLINLIKIYQFLRYILPHSGRVCVFYPTCSEYSELAIKKHGTIKGIFMSFWRILRCHPWQKHFIDPVK